MMNITILLGRQFIADEATADEFVNKMLVPQVKSLRVRLKNDRNIELPIVNIQDDLQLLDTEIVLKTDENAFWKENFVELEFNKIVDLIIYNLEQLQLS